MTVVILTYGLSDWREVTVEDTEINFCVKIK